MDLLSDFLLKNRTKKLKIHCVGDAMIDQYIDVKVTRISPESPAIVMLSQSELYENKPGGAANVAYQFKNFNVDTLLVCWCDEIGKRVFDHHKIKFAHETISETCSLPVKRRFLDDGVQIVRHDIESDFCGLNEESINFCVQQVEKHAACLPDVAILSDYNKGFFPDHNKVVEFYKGTKTIVDPKKGPLSKWKGCTIFKPNCKEATELTGMSHWKDQSRYIQQELECESVVITFGGEKVAGITCGEYFEFKPNRSVVVESVVGAGDCFAAFFAMAIGHGFSVIEASEIAWNAGANYVKNKRNRPIVPAELSLSKIVNPSDLSNRDFEIVFTNGCFDFGLTSAHVKCFDFAKKQSDKLVVAINSDESVKRLKGEGRPILTFEERSEIVAALECVDFVVKFEEDTPIDVIKTIKPSLIVKGGDYKKHEVVGNEICEVKIFPYIDVMSTTEKIKRSCENKD